MLQDEYVEGARRALLGRSRCDYRDAVLLIIGPPSVTCGFGPHRQANVVLAVQSTRQPRHRSIRNYFLNEHNATAHAFRSFSAHVKPKIDFGKIAPRPHRQSQYASVQELETYETHECFTLPQIDLET